MASLSQKEEDRVRSYQYQVFNNYLISARLDEFVFLLKTSKTEMIIFIGSITSRCSRNEPTQDRTRGTGPERSAEIEPAIFLDFLF